VTYSVIARDMTSGEIGAAMQSYGYGCGPRAIFAEPGVGIVVTQMIPDARYGSEGLARMRTGSAPSDALRELIEADAGRDLRQVAMINAMGQVAAYTGTGCVPASGQIVGGASLVQGAMVESNDVLAAVADAFASTKGPLADRLIGALRAGQTKGGDIRGHRAAALVIVSSAASPSWITSRPLNIHVDDSPDPLSELERHLGLQRHLGAIELAFERGFGGDVAGALEGFAKLAVETPDDPEVTLRYGIMLAMAGKLDEAREQLDRMSRVHAGWAKMTERLVAVGMLPDDPKLWSGRAS
jgi:uncharacterized Ntn-hydrolase superfamily protein